MNEPADDLTRIAANADANSINAARELGPGGLVQVTHSTEWLERMRFAQRAGLQYGTDRYIYRVAGYVPQGSLTFSDYWAKYDRQDVAGRIVDMPAKKTWRATPEIVELDARGEPVPGATEFTRAVEQLFERVKMWRMLERVDRLSGIGRYGLLLFGVRGVSDQEMRTPLTRVSGPDDIVWVGARHEGSVSIQSWVEDTGDPAYGMPELYAIEMSAVMVGAGSQAPNQTMVVHRSRVVHIAEDPLEDDVYGRPRLKRCMNLFNDMEKVTAATGESYWQLADRILLMSIDPNAKVDATGRQKLTEAIEEMMHDLRRHLVAQGLDGRWLESTPPDPTAAATMYMMLIGATAGIPYRVLFGNTTGERASTEDLKAWMGTIGERIETYASPDILRRVIDRLIEMGALPRPRHGYLDVWPPLWETPELEAAETNLAVARAAQAMTPVGGDPTALVTIDEDGRVKLIPRAEGDESPFDIPEPDEGEPGTPVEDDEGEPAAEPAAEE